jgi:hypothetical protein
VAGRGRGHRREGLRTRRRQQGMMNYGEENILQLTLDKNGHLNLAKQGGGGSLL